MGIAAALRPPHIGKRDTATATTAHDMFDALMRLLTGSDDAHSAGHHPESDDPALALAVLLLETARSDDSVTDSERRIIERTLARRFGLQPFETARLVEAARRGVIRSTDLYNSTRIVVQNFSEEERVGVIEMLWDVAYSDGAVTGDEDTLIRRVAGLLYVSDRDRGEAKRRARERALGT
jgi:uncharacterized tellurite resistance protein B-like protein